MASLLFDLRFAVRLLLKHRALTFAAIATLAGAIAANTANLFDRRWRAAASAAAARFHRLVRIEERHGSGRSNLTGATFADLVEAPDGFSAVAAFRLNSPGLSDGETPEQVISAEVSPQYFEVLGLAPAHGRFFAGDDFLDGARRVVVLSDAVWRRRFGSDPSAIGRTVLVNAVPAEVVGIMPGIFASGPGGGRAGQPEIWMPRTTAGALSLNRRAHLFTVLARMDEAQRIESVQSRLAVVSERIIEQSGGIDPDADGQALRERGIAPGSARMRTALVVAEIALTVILLSAAGLLARSFALVTRIDPGFDPRHVVAFDLSLPPARYPDAAAHARFYERVIEGLVRLPGVSAAAVTGALPMTGTASTTMVPEAGHSDQELAADVIPVSAQYMEAMRIPLRAGRGVSDDDRRGGAPVVVINEAAARQFWPAGISPLGRGLTMQDWGDPYRAEVVGIVGDVRQSGLDADVQPALYYPIAPFPETMLRQSIVIRTVGDPMAVVDAAREQVRAVDPDQPVASIRPLEDLLASAVAQRRFNMILIGGFAGAALLLAAIGVYGIVAFAVGQRTREIGVRVALGARPADVVRLVIAQGALPVILGIVAGAGGALAASRLLETLCSESARPTRSRWQACWPSWAQWPAARRSRRRDGHCAWIPRFRCEGIDSPAARAVWRRIERDAVTP